MTTTAPSGGRSRLSERIRATIAERGPMTFAGFMEAALYDPDDGFYSRLAVGERGHFVTSPHVSPVFGILIARQIREFWELLGRPDPFTVVEVGAGDGTLARQVMEALTEDVRGSTDYVAVERSLPARTSMVEAGFHAVSEVSQVPGGLVGCVIANELLDNLPFHRLRGTTAGPAELYVAVGAGGFELVEGPLSSPSLAESAPDLRPGDEWVVSPEAPRFLDQVALALARGYAWIIDYALERYERHPSVHGYRGHGIERDVLVDPGSRDITAGVDLDAVLRHARASGMTAWGPISQRDALLALGFRDLEHRARARQREAIAARRGFDAMRIYSNRTRANLLLAQGGLGDFSMLCLGVGIELPPAAFRDHSPAG